MLGSITTATLTVINVWCASGAPVNYEVTARVGDRWPVTDEDLANFGNSSGDVLHLSIPMTTEGRSYRNGRPPCPVGDELHVDVQKPVGS